ncbi:helix-turn-helix domain-containing protein [Rhizobium mesoamericanum]|uniref:helix-turn-helix domain-containing protein n=1 Tax=Rhizobium mesoamericanum TaxID=1079800 RepID=UPI00351FF64F
MPIPWQCMHRSRIPRRFASITKQIYMLCGGNMSKTARLLSMHRRTLQRLMMRHSLLR